MDLGHGPKQKARRRKQTGQGEEMHHLSLSPPGFQVPFFWSFCSRPPTLWMTPDQDVDLTAQAATWPGVLCGSIGSRLDEVSLAAVTP